MSESTDKSWWFVYGSGRTGTTYLYRLLATNAVHLVSDSGVGRLLNTLHLVELLDHQRYLSDLSGNILDNARRGGGRSIDLVFKQANSTVAEYTQLVAMFGEPQRKLFCMRNPAGYIASATKKFEGAKIEQLRRKYTASYEMYEKVGGDVLEYGPDLDARHIMNYLEEAGFQMNNKTEDLLTEFKYSGSQSDELVTQPMRNVYNEFLSKIADKGVSLAEKHYFLAP